MKKVIALIAIVLLAGLAGCVGGETGESLSTSTYPAEGTDKVWSCIEWELVNGTAGY